MKFAFALSLMVLSFASNQAHALDSRREGYYCTVDNMNWPNHAETGFGVTCRTAYQAAIDHIRFWNNRITFQNSEGTCFSYFDERATPVDKADCK